MPYRDPEDRRAWQRRRYANDPEYAERERARSRTTPKYVHRARQAVRTAVRNGTLVRPNVCSSCGKKGPIEAAHENYFDPLVVRWLCRSCHMKWDLKEPKIVR